jgi:hypothetical protein
MSYNLYIYNKKSSGITVADIETYLDANLCAVNDASNQWFFENEDTDVYFSFEINNPDEEPESRAYFNKFNDFDFTSFSFELNFMRPAFFGAEAFQFVEKFVKELGLYVLNPQAVVETPYIPQAAELYENWNATNLQLSKENFNDGSYFYPLKESMEIWKYNYHWQSLQQKIGDDFFVSRIFFCRTKENKIVTLSVWAEHIPIILPKTDYYLLTRKYPKRLKTIKDEVLISRDTLIDQFGSYFGHYPHEDHKDILIIDPDNAQQVAVIFNGLQSDLVFGDFIERIYMESLYNAKP